MPAHIVHDPATNLHWAELVGRHPAASIFHTPGWLNTLRETYGYKPFAITTSAGARFDSGLVACEVKGWGSRRIVSLPFSDHCDPLIGGGVNFNESLNCLLDHAQRCRADSVEIRPTPSITPAFAESTPNLWPGRSYCLHRIDLAGGEPQIFKRFHPSSTQRAIRRAEREGLHYESGTSEQLIERFYNLLRMSRRRHHLPPQPLQWFRNLVTNLGNQVSIHVASQQRRPVASILTLSFRTVTYYKYGGSDAAYHRLGAMPFLFWRVIQDAKQRGATELDLGRSDVDQPGLIAFKNHLGATPSTLQYFQYPRPAATARSHEWITRAARATFAYLPDAALDLAGRLIYKRLG